MPVTNTLLQASWLEVFVTQLARECFAAPRENCGGTTLTSVSSCLPRLRRGQEMRAGKEKIPGIQNILLLCIAWY